MPTTTKTKRTEEFLEAYESFAAAFARSSKGNLWTRDGTTVLTVFHRRDGYHWCIAEGNESPHYSKGHHPTEEHALSALFRYLFTELEAE